MKIRINQCDLEEIFLENMISRIDQPGEAIEEASRVMKYSFGEFDCTEMLFEGVHLSYGELHLLRDLEIEVESPKSFIEMHFNLDGHSRAMVKGGSVAFEYKSREHNICYMPSFDGAIQAPRQTQGCRYFEVHLTESYFARIGGEEVRALTGLSEVGGATYPTVASKVNGQVTPEMMRIVQGMISCRRTGVLKRLYLEAGILELLMLQLEQFQNPGWGELTGLKKCDIEKLHEARASLEARLTDPCSLSELARKVGLNDFKLKKGFKQLFGTTVFGYLYELRMQHAHRLLFDEKRPVEEVAQYCGYGYAHHFATAFRKKFGYGPRLESIA